tara:strand:+ start:131 stop:766 length:636 start_codon:yes stop_codon:yes gene_type:complete
MNYVLWTEKFVLPDDTIKNLMKRYQDPYFLKGDPDWGQHFTGYHRNPNHNISAGSIDKRFTSLTHQTHVKFIDKDLLKIYVPKIKRVMKLMGLINEKNKPTPLYSFGSIWGQLYKKDLRAKIDIHNHYMTPNNLLSYVHFIKTPPQKCFYFQVGDEKIYPETQNESDLIVYPSYASHGVDTMTCGTDRFVVAGNVTRMNSVPSSLEKKMSK